MNTATTMGATIALPRWRRLLAPLLLLLAAIVALYWTTGHGMVSIWSRSDTFAHAFAVPPLTLWLIWRQREQLARLTPQPAPSMLLALALAGAVWLVSELATVNAGAQFALVAMLVLAVPTVLGLQVARAVMFPLAFAFFALPVGEFAMPTLMQWTADFTVAALRLTGVPVYREGLRFVIPSGSWSVVEACSGVRYLMASFMVGSLFAYLNYRSSLRRTIFISMSIVVPVLANWLRAYIIVMLGHLSDNKIATGADHLVYGWVFFGIIITALFVIGARWSEPDAEPGAAAAATAPQRSTRLPDWLVPALAVLVVAAPVAALRLLDNAAGAPAAVKLELPAAADPAWRLEPAATPALAPAYQQPNAAASGVYANRDGARVGVHLIYYRQQQADRKLVSSINQVVRADDTHWNQLSSGTRIVSVGPQGEQLAVRELRLLSGSVSGQVGRENLRVWQVYWINGTWTASDSRAKLIAARDRLTGRSDDAAVLIVQAVEEQPGGAERALEGFLRTQHAAMAARLDAAAGR
jgi:exosortase A